MYEDLYAENKRLLYKIALRYAGACAFDRAVDVDDLAQAGFFGLVKAQETFNPDAGKGWVSWAAWYIHREMQKALGFREGKPARAHSGADSLDVTVFDDPDGRTMLDNLADERLLDAQEGVELAETRRAVRASVDALEGLRRDAVRLWGLGGMTKKQAARALDIPEKDCNAAIRAGIDTLRRNKRLQKLAYLDGITRFHAHKGVAAFHQDWTSVTEGAALWRIEMQERFAP